jgi:hypothetical protein
MSLPFKTAEFDHYGGPFSWNRYVTDELKVVKSLIHNILAVVEDKRIDI